MGDKIVAADLIEEAREGIQKTVEALSKLAGRPIPGDSDSKYVAYSRKIQEQCLVDAMALRRRMSANPD
jgi:hypothetical protein